MKVIIGAGGTGGHLYPALALVEYIKKNDPTSEFIFVGTKDRLESEVVPKLGYNYVGLNVRGMVGNPIKKAYSALIFIKSISSAKKVIKKFKPDIVIGFGGYPSASVVKAAEKLGVKTLIHEQNSIIGLTNKILINQVDQIVCCYEKAYNEFPKEKTHLLGNPRASVIVNTTPKDIFAKYGLDSKKKLITIVMGSLGSSSINNVMVDVLKRIDGKDYQVLYATGKNNYDEMMSKVTASDNVKIVPYIDDMPSVMNYTDVIVSRAGASTIAEITALGVPAILIPSPYVAANHQEYNALELVNKQAAVMIKEKDLNADLFIKEAEDIILDNNKQSLLKSNSKALGKPNALKDIYNLIEGMLKDGSKI
ncbi:MAG: undecaprenyldiphospho-muramoylpentapeptide beta-N-acetylglucosaminyltransferase [Thomasclavelia sp.]|nr:undecaprenyldiphospho-muramoylpentapeptide beta-N-acetylglucosaminyltransferase [Thomasclavelia sp.]